MKVGIIVPRRSDNGGRRDELWAFTENWLRVHHPTWNIYWADGPEGPFNRGAALNNAAQYALDDQMDVLVIHDADNITAPHRLEEAATRAREERNAWIPSDCYMYLDQASSDEITESLCEPKYCRGHFWPRPAHFVERTDPATPSREPGYNLSVRNKHISGIMAVDRLAWQKTGGFVPLTGWGREDSIFWLLLEHKVGRPKYLEGTTFHLFHEHEPENTTRDIKRENSRILNEVKAALKSPSPDLRLKRILERYQHVGVR